MSGMSAGVRGSCPCGLEASYDVCCGRFHRGEAAAPTPELLMRSRYTAFAVGNSPYLLATWHSSTRPARLSLDQTRWLRLEVLDATGTDLFAQVGTVRFRAHWELPRGGAGVLEEHSRFTRESGRWAYVGPID